MLRVGFRSAVNAVKKVAIAYVDVHLRRAAFGAQKIASFSLSLLTCPRNNSEFSIAT